MSIHTFDYWIQQRQQLAIEGRAYYCGQYQPSQNQATFACISPIDQTHLVDVASCDSVDADLAVNHARQCFESGVWSQASPRKRKQVLLQLAELMRQHQEELALLECLDMGKPISDALVVDALGAANCIQWYAEAIDKVYDEVASTPSSQIGMITREPVGVVAAIVPWNFPLLMACWKLGPALASGNSVILKPSEKSPLTAIKLAGLAKQAGVPDGVLQVLPGYGHTVGKALALHMDVDTLVFTGSTAVAKQLMIYAGESNMKRVWLEAGGKSPNIVCADAPDLQAAAEAAASAICFNQGEVCTAGSRLLIEKSIKTEFLTLLQNAMQSWQVGHPLHPDTKVGAIVDAIQHAKVSQWIVTGQQQGASTYSLSLNSDLPAEGLYVAPTLLNNVTNDMAVAQQEIFGPILSIIEFDDIEHAIKIANDTPYGLAAAIWTSNLSKAHRTAKALRAGSVWVNQYDGGDMTAPFGGFKQSGNGRDKSLHAFDKYTEIKATWIAI